MSLLKPETFLLTLGLCCALAGCENKNPQAKDQAAPPAPTVSVANPVKKDVTEFNDYVGRFVAVDYVEIRARVSGYLEKIAFNDGQLVKAGDPLFTIDKRPFEAALEQTKAAKAQAEAQLTFAESDVKRGESLVKGSTITQQTFDQRMQSKNTATASVASQTAAVKQSQLDLEFTELKAPIAGRIGDRRVSVGNLVTGGTGGSTTLLATIVSTDPIRFEFTIDEASYLRYKQAVQSLSTHDHGKSVALPVKLKLIDEKDYQHEGRIDFVDNAINESSGTIRLRAEFPNAGGKLTPGMFGRVQVPASAPETALLVPDTAIGTEQIRKFVYVVGPDKVVNPKYVTLGQAVEGLRVIKTGLDPADVVVVNGLMRIRPGAKVTTQDAPPDALAEKKQALQAN